MRAALFPVLFGGLDASTRSLLDAMAVKPPAPRARQIDRLIRGLKSIGVWDMFDVLYLLAAHDEQAARLNWKNPGVFTLTAVNSPAFTADRGFQGDGATSSLSSTLNLSTFGGQFALNSALVGGYVHLASSVVSARDVAATSTASIGASGSGTTYGPARMNDAGTVLSTGAPGIGHYAGRRNTSVGREAWKNGVLVAGPDATASVTVQSSTFNVLSTGAAGFSNARMSAAYAGGAPTDAQMLSMHTTLMVYLQAVGAA